MVRAFLVADAVIQDRLTGKWSVIGVFDRVMAPSFPVVHPTLGVYVKLADAAGRYRVQLELRDSTDRCVSAFPAFEMDIKDRGQAVELGFPTHMLPLEKPGKYQFQLHLNGEFAASCGLDAVKLETPPPSEIA
jgi:hypothetical protein